MRRISFALLLATAAVVPAAAKPQMQADPYCSRVPRALWLSATEIRGELQQRGLKLERIRFADQKCYTVRVQTADGRRKDLIIDPATGDIMP
jgi:hypothetical protein